MMVSVEHSSIFISDIKFISISSSCSNFKCPNICVQSKFTYNTSWENKEMVNYYAKVNKGVNLCDSNAVFETEVEFGEADIIWN